MNAILGFSELLERGVVTPKNREYVHSIMASGRSLLTLINDILDLSKIEAGRLELEYNPFYLSSVLREIELIFAHKVKEKGLSFEMTVDPTLPDMLILDEIRLRQILLNLIGNAVKFTEKGGVKLTARRGELEEAAGRVSVQITVEDSGIGIPAEELDSIFEAFVQRKGQEHAFYGGTGLGLTITRRLVDMLGGKLMVSSRPGLGSCFTVLFEEVAVALHSDEILPAKSFDVEAVNFSPAKILVVDDIESNRFLVKRYLEDYPFSVYEAVNGREAVEYALDIVPDLIIMDIKMPIMTGTEALRLLRSDEKTANIPVVALTASAMKHDEERYKESFNGFLSKPLSRLALLEELVRHLEHNFTLLEDSSESSEPEGPPEEMRERWPELLAELYTLLKVHEGLGERMMIDEIQNFSGLIERLGREYNYYWLTGWGDTLYRLAAEFDINGLERQLSRFPAIVDSIKRVIDGENGE